MKIPTVVERREEAFLDERRRSLLCTLGLHAWKTGYQIPLKGPDGEYGWHVDYCGRGCASVRWWKCPCILHDLEHGDR